ncbi:MAG: hypothetical protein BWY77_01073 [bacterium ADurb.Bin431]|nr:MAG: hypothetical protein BWY77_01073 [bacterium ADurb.Bin431]
MWCATVSASATPLMSPWRCLRRAATSACSSCAITSSCRRRRRRASPSSAPTISSPLSIPANSKSRPCKSPTPSRATPRGTPSAASRSGFWCRASIRARPGISVTSSRPWCRRATGGRSCSRWGAECCSSPPLWPPGGTYAAGARVKVSCPNARLRPDRPTRSPSKSSRPWSPATGSPPASTRPGTASWPILSAAISRGATASMPPK